LAIQWKDIRDIFYLTTSHEDVLVEAPSSRRTHDKIKPAAVLDKFGMERSDQVLSHYSFERKTKLWRKFFFLQFTLVVISERILHKNKEEKYVTGNFL
jgi:hypothetical protein